MKPYIVCGNGAGGVAGYQLELHIDLAEEILVLGLKAGAGSLVEGERQQLTIIGDCAAAIAPRYVEILVQITSICNAQQNRA